MSGSAGQLVLPEPGLLLPGVLLLGRIGARPLAMPVPTLHRLPTIAPRRDAARIDDLAFDMEAADQKVVAGVLQILEHGARVLSHQDRMRGVVVDAELIADPVPFTDPVQCNPWTRICERHGVGDQFRIHYDPSHAILMGQDSRSVFQYLKDTGYDFLIGGFHVKGQVIDSRGISAWGYGGQTMQRGDWHGKRPSADPAEQQNAWKKQTVFCEHELPGTARHDPLAYLQNRSVDWLDHQLAARELLRIDPQKTFLVVEHEYPKARVQDKARLAPILAGSLAFTRAIDEAAAAMYALQHEVLAAQGIPVQGIGRQAYRS